MKSILVLVSLAVFCVGAVGHGQQRGQDAPFPRELVSFGPPSAKPLLAGTGGDTWDRRMRERGWVMREGDRWHLWYTG